MLIELSALCGRTLRKQTGDLPYLLDSTPIALKGRGFDQWTGHNGRITGLKLHILMNHADQCPVAHSITDARVNDVDERHIVQPEKGANACANGCEMSVKRVGENLYRAGVYPAAIEIAPGQSKTLSADLYAGPQITEILKSTAPNLELAKDYGRVHIFAAPLFALLKWLHSLIGNWGWAIVVLTLIVKIVLYPLNNAAYRSTAKMRVLAPKMEALKKKYGEDKLAMQQAMMQLYKDEKINPLGGCLPMLVQMPIFIGLYWMIFLSVELRQAPWLGWISDLSRPDPWYVLPAMMAATMWFQTKLNPAPTDPMQAKIMQYMPWFFGFMFMWFPAGLVLYWSVNNAFNIVQQSLMNKRYGSNTPPPTLGKQQRAIRAANDNG